MPTLHRLSEPVARPEKSARKKTLAAQGAAKAKGRMLATRSCPCGSSGTRTSNRGVAVGWPLEIAISVPRRAKGRQEVVGNSRGRRFAARLGRLVHPLARLALLTFVRRGQRAILCGHGFFGPLPELPRDAFSGVLNGLPHLTAPLA